MKQNGNFLIDYCTTYFISYTVVQFFFTQTLVHSFGPSLVDSLVCLQKLPTYNNTYCSNVFDLCMSFVLFFLPIFLLLLGPIHQVWNDNVSYILNYAVIYYYKNLSNKINHIQCTIYVEGTVISDLYCSSRKLLMTFF